MLGCDWGLRMVINITCLKIPGSGFIFATSKYPSMTNKEIIQYTSVLFTQAPIRVVCLHDANIDSRTILVTMYNCGRLGYDWWLRMVINITCLKIPGSGFIFATSKYPSMTNKEIIQYTSVLFTQAPIRVVCLHDANIDSRTILVTMYNCGRLGYDWWLRMVINVSVQYSGGLLPDIILLTQGYYQWGTRLNTM